MALSKQHRWSIRAIAGLKKLERLGGRFILKNKMEIVEIQMVHLQETKIFSDISLKFQKTKTFASLWKAASTSSHHELSRLVPETHRGGTGVLKSGADIAGKAGLVQCILLLIGQLTDEGQNQEISQPQANLSK